MSGPLADRDALAPPSETPAPAEAPAIAAGPVVEISVPREARVGSMTVRRALPRKARRTVGAWCFVDRLGPVTVGESGGLDIGPHPHIGLQTVTWLLAGEAVHRDSLGSEQLLRPGQLNLMTAGHGVAHAEEHTGRYAGEMHGVQLWVAQPEQTRHGPADFAHHAELPSVELGGSSATVFVGMLAGVESPARRDTDHVGAQLDLRGAATVPLVPAHEHAVLVLSGALSVEGQPVPEGCLAYLGTGRDDCQLDALGGSARALLLGGAPFEEQVFMWWNFVARTGDEIVAAYRQWTAGEARFGSVDSRLARIPVGPPPWLSDVSRGERGGTSRG